MRPIVTDRLAWSVGLSVGLTVCHTSDHAKTAEVIEMRFGFRTRVGPIGRMNYTGSRSPTGKGNFEWERGEPL